MSCWCARAGLKVIQILPVNDTSATHTWTDSYPYSAISAFALHPQYLNLSRVAAGRNKALLKNLEPERRRLNALAELAANRGSEDLPLAVWVAHQHAPSTITVPRASGVCAAADLAGKRILGHASDVALKTFPLYARASGLAADAVTIVTSPDPMRT